MASAGLNVCRFYPSAGGTTDWTYSSTVPGYQSPSSAGAVNGTIYSVRAEGPDLLQWETSTGAYNSGVFARSNVLFNSSGSGLRQGGAGTKISFTGTPQVAVVALAEDLVTPAILRSYLAGLTLSTAGASATFGIAAGVAVDSTNADWMSLLTAFTKTTASWALGSGVGALDTGVIANTTWYFPHLIKRLDTGVVDLLISLSPTAPTLPSGYTLFRRLGSIRTNASGQWSKFTQRDDTFLWDADDAGNAPFVNGAPGVTTAVTRGCTAPIGIQVDAILRVNISGSAASNCLFSSLDRSDEAPTGILNLCIPTGTSMAAQAELTVRTNTSAQFRTRLSNAATILYYSTAGWIDTRGKLN